MPNIKNNNQIEITSFNDLEMLLEDDKKINHIENILNKYNIITFRPIEIKLSFNKKVSYCIKKITGRYTFFMVDTFISTYSNKDLKKVLMFASNFYDLFLQMKWIE